MHLSAPRLTSFTLGHGNRRTWSSHRNLRCHASAEEHAQVHQKLDVYAISDLHCDYDANMKWVRDLPNFNGEVHTKRVLLVAGDVSSSLGRLRDALAHLKERFWLVMYVPGNHCLWLSSDQAAASPQHHLDSVSKLKAVIAVCMELGVQCEPLRLGNLIIAPTYSWHHQSWDTEPDIPGRIIPKASKLTIGDYVKCVWPAEVAGPSLGDVKLAEWMDSLNDVFDWGEIQRLCSGNGSSRNTNDISSRKSSSISSNRGEVESSTDASKDTSSNGGQCVAITFSHFLPFQGLLPEKRFLTFPNLAKAVGSQPLGKRISSLQPLLHVFGHSHFAWDSISSGVRCIQAPLCYPNERKERMRSLRLSSSALQLQMPLLQKHAQAECPWLPLLVCSARYSIQRKQHQQLANSGLQQHSSTTGQQQQQQQHTSNWEHQHHVLGQHPQSAGALALLAALDRLSEAKSPSIIADACRSSCSMDVSAPNNLALQESPCSKSSRSSRDNSDMYENRSNSDNSDMHNSRSSSDKSDTCDSRSSRLSCLLAGLHQQQEGVAVEMMNWELEPCPPLYAVWSHYYQTHEREPHNTELAPWVASLPHYRRRRAKGY